MIDFVNCTYPVSCQIINRVVLFVLFEQKIIRIKKCDEKINTINSTRICFQPHTHTHTLVHKTSQGNDIYSRHLQASVVIHKTTEEHRTELSSPQTSSPTRPSRRRPGFWFLVVLLPPSRNYGPACRRG